MVFFSRNTLFKRSALLFSTLLSAGLSVQAAPEVHTAQMEAGFSASPFLKSVTAQASTQPVRATPTRYIRVGLVTDGSAIQLLASGSMTVTDASQPSRRLAVKAGEIATFFYGANTRIAARGAVYTGPITIRTDAGNFGAWQTPRIWTNGNSTRISSNGQSPRYQRAYRGHFEIAPKSFSFEPAKHKGSLRLVNIVPLEEYLKGVVPWEMNRAAPLEALKAQAVCARSETLSKIQGGRHSKDGFDICDYDHCQGYPGTENESARTSQAVEQTAALVLTHNGQIADAVYGTNSGGITASSEDVWRGPPEPYLKSKRDFSSSAHQQAAQFVKANMSESDWVKYCTTNLPTFGSPGQAEVRALAARRARSPRTAALFQANDLPEFYRWTRVVSPYDLAKALASRGGGNLTYVSAIRVEERAPSGHIKKLLFTGQEVRNNRVVRTANVRLEGDSQIRAMLSGRLGSTTALPSSTFVVLPRIDGQRRLQAFVLRGAGWGHGVGMCQRGAQNRANAGWKARQILEFYFKDVELRKIR